MLRDPSAELAVIAAGIGARPVVGAWRAWFDHSADARRRRPEPDA